MSDPAGRSLGERVADLERSVARIETTLKGLLDALARRERGGTDQPQPRAPSRTVPASLPSRPPPPSAAAALGISRRPTEWWLSRVGVGLLLLGVAFLFKYAVDQGWLTPWVRVAFGVALGGALAIIGLRVPSAQRWFRPAVSGGAAATWYITGFAAFQVLELVSYAAALAFMVLVTVFTFWAAIRENAATLGVLGAAGGYGTPFMLYGDAGTVPGLVAYTCLVLAGTSGIYLMRGWLTLLWTQVAGAWGLMLMALAAVTDPGGRVVTDQWAVEVGALVAWLGCWAVPLARQVLHQEDPARWPAPERDRTGRLWRAADRDDVRHVAVLAVAVPLLAFATSVGAWDLGDAAAGFAALGGALLYAETWRRLDAAGRPAALTAAHGVAAAILVAIGLGFLFEQHALLVAWAALAAGVHALAARRHDRPLSWTAHLLFGIVLVWLLVRIGGEDPEGRVVLNWRAAADAAALALGLAAARALERPDVRRAYGLLALAGTLGLVWRELARVSQGDAYVSIAWGVLGVALLVAGLRRDSADLRRAALGTLALVVAKLFLVDLSQLEAIWRIALFLGFGGLFLTVSYYFRAWWKGAG